MFCAGHDWRNGSSARLSSLLAGPAELLVRGVEELGVIGLGEAVAPVGSVLRPVRVR